jgi:hypothetical protein
VRAHHRLGDADAIRSLLRQLTLALSELDVEPSEVTVELADRLCSASRPDAGPAA